MQANPVAIRICNPGHPAYARLDWFDEDFDAMSAANLDRSTNVVHRQRDARRSTPVPFRMPFIPRTVKTKSQRFGGDLTQEIIPLVPAFEAKKLLIEGAGAADVFCVIHHEIKGPNGNCSPTR